MTAPSALRYTQVFTIEITEHDTLDAIKPTGPLLGRTWDEEAPAQAYAEKISRGGAAWGLTARVVTTTGWDVVE